MNINLFKLCLSSNRCKNVNLIKSSLSSLVVAEHKKPFSVCQCSFFSALSGDLTSKQNSNVYSYPKDAPDKGKTSGCRRFLCSTSNQPSNKLPPLTNFPPITWPSLIKSIRNFILTTFIIKPYLDREFNLPDFVKGSKRAVEVISKKLSEGDIKTLQGLVSGDIIPSLQKAIAMMSLTQREQLSVNSEDIYFSFPYQVGIIFNDDDDKEQKRYVEITMVYHTLRGLAAMRSRGEEPPLNMGMMPEYQRRISICNYRFIREFTKGVEGEWTVNLLNHFNPADELDN